MQWYYVEGGQQAGPVEDAFLDELVRTGRVQPDTLVWREGMASWEPYRQARPRVASAAAEPGPAGMAELAPAGTAPGADQVVCAECRGTFPRDSAILFGTTWVCAACKPIFVQKLSEGVRVDPAGPGLVTEAQLLEREYRIEIGECLEKAWRTVWSNLGWVLLSCLVYGLFLIVVGIGMGIVAVLIGFRPTPGVSIPAAQLIPLGAVGLVLGMISVVLSSGFSWFYLNLLRTGQPSLDHLFFGFRRPFGNILGSWVVQLLVGIAISIPFTLAARIMKGSTGNTAGAFGISLLFQFISSAISVYFTVLWTFSYLLIMDKGYRFWPALRLSRAMVSRRWWMTFLLLFVGGAIAASGFILFCIGVMVTIPIFGTMKAALYDDNFRDLAPPTS